MLRLAQQFLQFFFLGPTIHFLLFQAEDNKVYGTQILDQKIELVGSRK